MDPDHRRTLLGVPCSKIRKIKLCGVKSAKTAWSISSVQTRNLLNVFSCSADGWNSFSALIVDRTGSGAYPRQADPRMTLQKLPRVKCGSLSASTSALTLPKVVSG